MKEILDDYLTEAELVAEGKKRGLKVSPRTLREWRAKNIGPPFAFYGRIPIYPKSGHAEWLAAGIKKPRRASA